ncbi:hypothetical protein Vafri_11363 [Volvox africanus]|nr:hypothetical protein Vafri_11363 [Volvox africanus]
MGSLTETAAAAFRTIPNVTHVAAIIDSWLGASYANMNTLSIAKLQALADAHAQLYCASTLLSGVQLDLEPYSTTYKTSVLTFVKRLAQNFRDSAVCSRGPKFLSFFVGPRQADAALFNALGPNGFAVVSGYDLDSPGPGLPETPQQYKTNLKSNIQFVMSTAATSTYGKFAIGLPFSASVCEFETAISITDPSKVIAGYPMYNTSQPGYIPAAFEVLNQTLGVNATRLDSRYLGVSVWGFLSRDVVVSGYRHLPKNAFDTPGLMTYLLSNMPKKAAMTP